MNRCIGILFFCALASTTAQANGLVGNSGEGVRLATGLELRDLYEQGVTLPYFGEKIDPRIAQTRARAKLPSSLLLNEEKFLRKLTDLNTLRPMLGDLVLRALDRYEISFSENALPLARNDSPSVPEHLRVQLAVRYIGKIQLSFYDYQSLNEDQRIALLIHEGLYSMLRVKCEANDVCQQFSLDVREIVGRFFREGFDHDQSLKLMVEDRLHLVPLAEACAEPPISVSLKFWRTKGVELEKPFLREATRRFSEFNPELSAFIRDFCTDLPTRPGDTYVTTANVALSILDVNFYPYQSPFGRQLAMRTFKQSRPSVQSWAHQSARACEVRATERINSKLEVSFGSISLAGYCGWR